MAKTYTYEGPCDRLRLVDATAGSEAVYLYRGVATPLEGAAARKAEQHKRVRATGGTTDKQEG